MDNSTVQIPALDLRHLAEQTQGDHALEHHLLALFRAQARQIILDLQNGGYSSAFASSHFVHLLKGSALAIGATRVAAMAAAYESLLNNPALASPSTVLGALVEAVEDAVGAIDRRIGPA